LSEYTNVYGTALVILKKKGYQLWRDGTKMFWAEKDGWDFCSDSPCGLLGLIAIFETIQPDAYREYWWRTPEQIDTAEMPEVPSPYKSGLGAAKAEGTIADTDPDLRIRGRPFRIPLTLRPAPHVA
jgi:hypothetical protein